MHLAFILTTVTVRDAEAFAAYRAAIAGVNDRIGGEMLVRGSAIETLEGEPGETEHVVAIGFASVEAARAYIRSPEYQAALPLREAAGSFRIRLIA